MVQAIEQRVALALYWMKASTGDWDEGEPETGEPVFDVAWHWDAPFAVLGPAGSGKSTTVMVAVEKAQAVGGARVGLPYADAGGRLSPEVPRPRCRQRACRLPTLPARA